VFGSSGSSALCCQLSGFDLLLSSLFGIVFNYCSDSNLTTPRHFCYSEPNHWIIAVADASLNRIGCFVIDITEITQSKLEAGGEGREKGRGKGKRKKR